MTALENVMDLQQGKEVCEVQNGCLTTQSSKDSLLFFCLVVEHKFMKYGLSQYFSGFLLKNLKFT